MVEEEDKEGGEQLFVGGGRESLTPKFAHRVAPRTGAWS